MWKALSGQFLRCPELVFVEMSVHEVLSIATPLLTRNSSLLSCLVNVFRHFLMAFSSSLMSMEESEIAWSEERH